MHVVSKFQSTNLPTGKTGKEVFFLHHSLPGRKEKGAGVRVHHTNVVGHVSKRNKSRFLLFFFFTNSCNMEFLSIKRWIHSLEYTVHLQELKD